MTNPTQLTLPGETHRNHFLFSDYFLNNRLNEQPEWGDDVAPLLEQLTGLWRAFDPDAPNEAQTEADWIRPALAALGHHFNVQVSLQTPFGTRQPDYVLYPTEAERKAAPGGVLSAADLTGALAVADAKAWERDLDRGVGRAKVLSDNPSLQIYVYTNHSGLKWGLLTNGRHWRLYQRDSAEKLDVYYEVDLPALIEQENADAFKFFALFFRREAFTAPPGGQSFLNRVLAQSRAYSRGVSDTLKEQVYEALRHLAQGFFDFEANRLDPTPATLQAVFDNSLIVLYRLLFILYAESRGLLPVPANRLYSESYSLDALKRRIVRELTQGKPAAASMTTFWQQLRQLWQVIDQGNPDLEVPAYDGGLFRRKIGSFLEQYQVGDLHLRQAIDLLARAPDPQGQPQGRGQRSFVDYRDLEIRHLGSIYEGLLEYHLRLAQKPLAVRVEKGREVYEALPENQTSQVSETWEVSADINPGEVYLITDKGERKATGSYYTPDYIVKYIVTQTVQPILDELRRQHSDAQGNISDPAGLEQAILRVNVLDPSMGSGHFLVEATDFIARYLVQLELPKPPEAEFESDLAYWRRRVVQACIYGVDLNPLAVELAKLSLWLTTVAQGKPLSFLDHHLRCGNSLIGTRVEDLPLNIQSAGQKRQAKRRKKAEAEQRAAGQLSMLDDSAFAGSMRTATGFMDQIEHLKGNTVAEIQEAEAVYRQVVEEVTAKARQLADIWTARHFGLEMDDRLWLPLVNFLTKGGLPLPAYDAIFQQAESLAHTYRFFHWELEFPEVFFDAHGRLDDAAGFDAVVGNPPYVRQEELGELKDYFEQEYPEVYHGVADLYVYFLSQGVNLLRKDGKLGYITSSTFRRLNFGKSLREFLASRTKIEIIVDFGDEQVFEEALTYPIILIVQKRIPTPKDTFLLLDPISLTEVGSPQDSKQYILPEPNKQWVFIPADLKHVLHGWRQSKPLSDFLAKPIYRGVSTGFNTAFVIDKNGYEQLLKDDPNSSQVVKPYIRGEDLKPWYHKQSGLWLIFTRRGIDIDAYPAVKSYLEEYRIQLKPRPKDWNKKKKWPGRKPGAYKWYEIQDTVAYFEVFEQPRIHSTKVSLFPAFSLKEEPLYAANTSYVLPISDMTTGYYLLGVLNSRISEYYSRKVFSPKANGYYEVQPQNLSNFPIPDTTAADREALGELAMQLTEQAKARYQLHRQSRHRIQADLGAPEKKLNQKLTSWWELDFAAFRREIKKVYKRDIALGERDEWEGWLIDRRAKHQVFTQEIVRLETMLNERVYALFDLSPEEIGIIEESTKYRYGEV